MLVVAECPRFGRIPPILRQDLESLHNCSSWMRLSGTTEAGRVLYKYRTVYRSHEEPIKGAANVCWSCSRYTSRT